MTKAQRASISQLLKPRVSEIGMKAYHVLCAGSKSLVPLSGGAHHYSGTSSQVQLSKIHDDIRRPDLTEPTLTNSTTGKTQ